MKAFLDEVRALAEKYNYTVVEHEYGNNYQWLKVLTYRRAENSTVGYSNHTIKNTEQKAV